MAEKKMPTIIRIRRGINGFKYSACDEKGYFIRNMCKLGDARRRWNQEIRWGQVVLVRELDKQPDMSRHEATLKAIDAILKQYSKRGE